MDFLGSLISRNVTAVRTQSVIQPRVASMFEPVSMESAAAFEEPVIETHEAAMETVSGPVEVRQNQLPAVAEIETARPRPVVPAPRPIASRPAPLRPQTTPVDAVVPSVEPEPAEIQRRAIATIASEVTRPDPAPAPELEREAEIFVRQAATTRTLLVERPARAGVEAAAPAPQSHPAASPANPSAVRTRRTAGRLANLAEPGRTSEEPTIQVTIGRVEVRATTPQAGPARRTAPPGMTIDDYLRKRHGGGGR